MRINVSKGSDALGLAKYILDPKKQRAADLSAGQPPILDANMFGRNPTELAEEFRFSQDLNPRVSRTITHYSISLPPGERVSDAQKVAISRDLLHRMGHQDCQYFLAAHHDQEHKNDVEHWHICTSSIDLTGRWVPDHFNYLQLKQVERDLELQHGLRDCSPKSAGERVNLTSGERRLEERTGRPCTKRFLWTAIDQAIGDLPTLPIMMARLKAQGLSVEFCEFEQGGKGLKFGAEGKYFKGRDLGARYSFTGLQKHAGLSYQVERDDPMLRQLNRMTAEQCQALLMSQSSTPAPSPQSQQISVQSKPDIQKQTLIRDAAHLLLLIWRYSQAGQSKLKSITFEGYQIQLDDSAQLALYRDGRKVLERSQNRGRSLGLAPADLDRLQAWQNLVLQQYEKNQIQEKTKREIKKQQKSRSPKRSSQKSPDLEL